MQTSYLSCFSNVRKMKQRIYRNRQSIVILLSLISMVCALEDDVPLSQNQLREKFGQGITMWLSFQWLNRSWFSSKANSFQRIPHTAMEEVATVHAMARKWLAILSLTLRITIQCQGMLCYLARNFVCCWYVFNHVTAF